jgi:GTP-binding protein YchF
MWANWALQNREVFGEGAKHGTRGRVCFPKRENRPVGLFRRSAALWLCVKARRYGFSTPRRRTKQDFRTSPGMVNIMFETLRITATGLTFSENAQSCARASEQNAKLKPFTEISQVLKAGIVGLPNVGKSTLFNALTRTRKAVAANYPFCTIDPNVGIVIVPDARLAPLAAIAKTAVIIPAAVEFVDIAGLVEGASQGEGLGNHFLSHIREVDAIVQVVRCFEDSDIHHVAGAVDPVRDIETVSTELLLADLEAVRKRLDKSAKDVKRGDKAASAEAEVLRKFEKHFDAGKPGVTLELTPEEKTLAKSFFLLTDKPTIFAANVKETDLAGAASNPSVEKVRQYARTHHACETVVISAQLESDLVDLTPDEAEAFLKEMGVEESGIGSLIRSTYHLLGLRTYFTAGEKEVRAWTIRAGDTAPVAAGVIHSDFQRGFIKAETVAYEDLVQCGSVAMARERGLYRMEGKEYQVADGDVILFKFNV